MIITIRKTTRKTQKPLCLPFNTAIVTILFRSRAVCLFNDTPITSAMPHDIMLCCGALVSGGAVTVFILLNLIYDNALTK
jgi:hypothetical protein